MPAPVVVAAPPVARLPEIVLFVIEVELVIAVGSEIPPPVATPPNPPVSPRPSPPTALLSAIQLLRIGWVPAVAIRIPPPAAAPPVALPTVFTASPPVARFPETAEFVAVSTPVVT